LRKRSRSRLVGSSMRPEPVTSATSPPTPSRPGDFWGETTHRSEERFSDEEGRSVTCAPPSSPPEACAAPRCGELIAPGAPWDLGHDDHDRSQYIGPEHRSCSRASCQRRPPASAVARQLCRPRGQVPKPRRPPLVEGVVISRSDA
jgi:hypothetical protein